jgi:hypothetical protein
MTNAIIIMPNIPKMWGVTIQTTFWKWSLPEEARKMT